MKIITNLKANQRHFPFRNLTRGASGPQEKEKKKKRNYVEPNFHNNKKNKIKNKTVIPLLKLN